MVFFFSELLYQPEPAAKVGTLDCTTIVAVAASLCASASRAAGTLAE